MNKYILAGAVLLTIAASAGPPQWCRTRMGGYLRTPLGVLAASGTVARWVEARAPGYRFKRRSRAGGALARWLEANVNPLPHVWATLVRLSFKGQTTDPVALRQRPIRVETWPIVGPMPCEQRSPHPAVVQGRP